MSATLKETLVMWSFLYKGNILIQYLQKDTDSAALKLHYVYLEFIAFRRFGDIGIGNIIWKL